jgi:tetratricopeptide (TPR) repeat protein
MHMLDKIRKTISDKKPAGKKLIPIVLGLSGAMWAGAGATWFVLKDKAIGPAAGHEAAGHGETRAAEDAEGADNEHAELAGIPASAHAEEAAEETNGHSKAHGEGREGARGTDAEAHLPAADARGAESASATHDEAAGHGAPEAGIPETESAEGSVPTREELAALRQVAEMRVAAGDLADAVAPLRRMMSMPTRDAALLSLAARVFLGTGNYAEAFRYAGRLIELDPGDMAARVQAVESQYRMGQAEQAMRAAEEALARHPGDLAMLVALGTIQVERGPGSKGYGEALARALKLKHDYAPALYLQGRKAQLEGDFKDAETAFTKVLKLDPENAKALGQLGMAQYHLGKGAAAEKSFRAELSRNPADYNTWYNLGELLLGRANEETNSEAVRRFRADAMECYLKSIELNPEHAQARYRVGVLLIGNGQCKEAIRHLEAALRLDARHVPTLVQLALAYEYLKQPERARAYLNRAFELDPLNKLVLSKLRSLS